MFLIVVVVNILEMSRVFGVTIDLGSVQELTFRINLVDDIEC